MKRNKIYLYSFLGPKFLISGDKDAFSTFLVQRGTFPMEDLFPAFIETKGQSELLAMAV